MYFNSKYKRVGTLFQNRYKSKLCDKDSYFLGASRYIHLNPLEAGFVFHPKDYPWSSFQEIFGDSKYYILDTQNISFLIGNIGKDREAYRKFILDGIKNLEEYKYEYNFEKDIEGPEDFTTRAQRKYLRRRVKKA
jgi:hypothetical protein